MGINYLAVLACGVLALVLGFVWFGPLFGKLWMRVVGVTAADISRRREMQKNMLPRYGISFVLALVQAWVLAHFIYGWQEVPDVRNALWLWLGFVVPTVAAGAMWNTDGPRASWMRFFLMAGYYLVLFAVFGYILSVWR
jgi:hypothetical protein